MVGETEKAVIGGRIAAARKKCGINQKELAELAGIEQSQVSAQENGKHRVQIELLLALVERYRVNANWVLTGKGRQFLDETEGEVLEIDTAPRGKDILFRVIQKLEDMDARLRAVENKK